MPLVETLPVGADTAQWPVWGTVARIVVTDPAAAGRGDRPGPGRAGRRGRGVQPVPGRLRAAPRLPGRRPAGDRQPAARRPGRRRRCGAARDTGGDVDPTVGAALCGLGYDRDFAALTGRRVAPAVRVFPTPDWRAVRLRDRELTVPDGVLLDLGATAKAAAADRAAARVAVRLGVGVLVALGGDIATAGTGAGRRLAGAGAGPARRPALHGPAAGRGGARHLQHRRADLGRPGELLHHIVDPRTGRPARPVWRTVSVAAFSPACAANTLSTAAIVRGHAALRICSARRRAGS